MFTGRISLYKNIGGKEERFEKTFRDQKKFDEFVEKNPDLKNLRDWKPFDWPEPLLGVSDLFRELEAIKDQSLFSAMEKEAQAFFKRSKKLLSATPVKKSVAKKPATKTVSKPSVSKTKKSVAKTSVAKKKS